MPIHLTFEQQKQAKAIGTTLGVHILLLLFFLFFTYSMPEQQPPEAMGMAVNLGTSDNGSGTDQPEQIGEPANATNTNAASSSGSWGQTYVLHGLMTTQNLDAPGVNISNKNKHGEKASQIRPNDRHGRNATATETVAHHKATVRKPKYIFAGANGQGNGNGAVENAPGSNEGIGTGTGDMGVPNGTPGASNYKGIPGGYGNVSALVANRYLVARPKPKAKFDEAGKVVIRVTVNRQGNITDHRVESAANATLRRLALRKLKAVRFNKVSGGPPEQHGVITFDFRTH